MRRRQPVSCKVLREANQGFSDVRLEQGCNNRKFSDLGVLITCDSPSELIRAIVRGALASDGLHNVEQQSPCQPRRCKLEYSISFHKLTSAG